MKVCPGERIAEEYVLLERENQVFKNVFLKVQGQ